MTDAIISQDLLKTTFDYHPDGVLLWKIRKPKVKHGAIAGGLNAKGYRRITIQGKKYGANRLVFLWHHGWLPDGEVDHKDNNKSNDRIENLRAGTRNQNLYNTLLRRNNTSGAKGVSWFKPNSKWRVQINVNGKKYHVGYYDSLDDAKRAAVAARLKHHGEFCNHG